MTPSQASLALLKDGPGMIYLARNKVNGKCYVGQTRQLFRRRKYTHAYSANYAKKTVFSNAIRKYGMDGFEWTVLQECCCLDCLNQCESWWIAHFNSMVPNGYNLTGGGGVKLISEQTRKKMSENGKRRGMAELLKIYRDTYHQKGATPEHRENMAKAMRGRKKSPEHRKKMSEVRKGKQMGSTNPFFGKEHTEEVKNKISEAMKKAMANPERRLAMSNLHRGKKYSDEQRKKLSESLKGKMPKGENHHFFGRHYSDEEKKNLSEKNKGKVVSVETRAKLSEAAKGNKANLGKKFTEEHKRKIGEASKRNQTWLYFNNSKGSGNKDQIALDFENGSSL